MPAIQVNARRIILRGIRTSEVHHREHEESAHNIVRNKPQWTIYFDWKECERMYPREKRKSRKKSQKIGPADSLDDPDNYKTGNKCGVVCRSDAEKTVDKSILRFWNKFLTAGIPSENNSPKWKRMQSSAEYEEKTHYKKGRSSVSL